MQIMEHGLETAYVEALTSDRAMDAFVRRILDLGYNATLDSPMAMMLPALLGRFPEAKVLLAVRDSPEAWARSYAALNQHLYVPFLMFPWTRLTPVRGFALARHKFLPWLPDEVAVPCPDTSPLWLLPWYRPCLVISHPSMPYEQQYTEWNAWVRRVASEQGRTQDVLEFNVKQGWEPLSRFLGRSPPPDTPFPNINESQGLRDLSRFLFFVSAAWPFIALPLMYAAARLFVAGCDALGSSVRRAVTARFRVLQHA